MVLSQNILNMIIFIYQRKKIGIFFSTNIQVRIPNSEVQIIFKLMKNKNVYKIEYLQLLWTWYSVIPTEKLFFPGQFLSTNSENGSINYKIIV